MEPVEIESLSLTSLSTPWLMVGERTKWVAAAVKMKDMAERKEFSAVNLVVDLTVAVRAMLTLG